MAGIAIIFMALILRYEFVAIPGSVLGGYRLDRWTGEVVSFIGPNGQQIAIERSQIDPNQVAWDKPENAKQPSSR